MTDIEVYFSYIFNPKSFEYSHVKNMLNSYCGLKGNSTVGYMDCYFSPEWQDYGLEYFGEDKVLFDSCGGFHTSLRAVCMGGKLFNWSLARLAHTPTLAS